MIHVKLLSFHSYSPCAHYPFLNTVSKPRYHQPWIRAQASTEIRSNNMSQLLIDQIFDGGAIILWDSIQIKKCIML